MDEVRVGEVVPPTLKCYLIIAAILGGHIACLRQDITTSRHYARISSSEVHD